jgi:hypothetical protein
MESPIVVQKAVQAINDDLPILQLNGLSGESGGTRTRNHRLKRAMLYQLSYRPACAN